MKISKSVLQAVVVGVAMSTSVSSCSFMSDSDELQLKTDIIKCDTDNGHHSDDCPGCGMG